MADITKAVVWGGVVKHSTSENEAGSTRFYVDVHESDGAVIGVWDGESVTAARLAASEWGVPVIDATAA